MPKIVVSNTTPILNLIKVDQLNLLEKLYGRVYIPFAVYEEIEAGKKKKWYADLRKQKFIEIKKIEDNSAVNYIIDLDRGEAEAIILGKEIKAGLVLMDEHLGRKYAENFGLKVTGTVGLLLKGFELGFINDISVVLERLKERGTYLSDSLIKKIVEIAQKSKRK